MEGLLRSPEMAQIDELYAKAWDFTSGVVYFPVRHHSPACALHLQKTIDRYKPEAILIEGPSDANAVIKYLEHEQSQAPLCIYYSYADKKGLLGEKDGKYRCYYPFLDYSPELVALREAKARDITAQFIDLPYPEILSNSKQGQGLMGQDDKQSYNDEYLLERSKFIQSLCRREGCRDFHELWEKLYELDGVRLPTEIFLKNMLAFCYLARVDYTKEMLEEDATLARERFMAEEIRKARDNYARVLVVTGGFHTQGLLEYAEKPETILLHGIDSADTGAYPMAYSFEESDQLGGYASGMPHPAFYQKVWENINCGRDYPFEQAVLHFIVRSGGKIRKSTGGLSTADEIEAFSMAKGLRGLREKPESGVFELLDGVRTAFVKGELNLSSEAPLTVLKQLLQGKKLGKLCQEADVPPIVLDFRDKARRLKIKTDSTVEQELVLDVYKNKRHRDISKFLHSLAFLQTGFCRKIKGPDLINKRGLNLVRETWKYKWSVGVESRLLELSVYGGSVGEAAKEILARNFTERGEHAGQASLLMVEAFLMGLEEGLAEIMDSLAESINQDGNFYSTAQCAYTLSYLYSARKLLGTLNVEQLTVLLGFAYQKSTSLMPRLYNTGEGEENLILEKLKDLYFVSLQRELCLEQELLGEALESLLSHSDGNSCIEGAATGLLLGLNRLSREAVVARAMGYLSGTGVKFLQSVSFLKGLFATARDIVLADGTLLTGIDQVIGTLSEEEFLRLVPELRLSFSYFTPGEIHDIAARVASMYEMAKEQVLFVGAVPPSELALGLELEAFALKNLKKWGIAHE